MGLRPYSEINLDENPIVVVVCGHFFAGQTLDGLVGLDEVYSQDHDGQFVGLKDIYSSLSANLPFCPECKCPLRQFAVRRYNRLVNRAVMDAICRKFLIQTRDAIQQLEKDLRSAEKELRITRATVSSIAERYSKLEELRNSAALIKRETLSVAKQIDKEKLGGQLTLRVHLFTTKVYEVRLRDYFAVANNFMDLSSCESPATWPKFISLSSIEGWLDFCSDLIKRAADTGHPRVVTAATLSFAKIERLLYFSKNTGVG